MVVGGSDWRARLALMEKIQTRHEAEMEIGFLGTERMMKNMGCETSINFLPQIGIHSLLNPIWMDIPNVSE